VSVALASHLRRSFAARCITPRPRSGRRAGDPGARAGAAAVAVAVTLAAASVLAQAPPAPERPAVGPARPFQLAPRAERTLPNGLHVIVTRQTVVPKVSVTLTVRAGYSSDPADLTGLAALTGDLIQEGTRTRSSQEIRHQVFGMGGSLTASASQDFTTISARGLAEFASGLIGLVADVAMNPTFPAEELAIMKEQHLQGVEQQAASPQFLANREFRRQLFGSHPYARTSETAESIGAMDRDRIVAFHRDHYRPNNAFLLIVGDVQAEQVFAAADTAFAGWARGDVPQPTFAAAPALTGRHVYFVQRPNSIQSSISVGNLAAKRSDPRWFDMTLANSIFGGAFDSRIIRNIREDKGYTYSPSSAFVAFANAGFYKFGADVRNEVTGATLGGLSATLNNVYVFNLPKDYPETFRSTIAELTPARVKAGANALLGSADAVIVIVGDYAKVKDQLGAFKNITFLDINGNKTAAPAPQ
jgi:zinc protease